VQSTQSRKTEG